MGVVLCKPVKGEISHILSTHKMWGVASVQLQAMEHDPKKRACIMKTVHCYDMHHCIAGDLILGETWIIFKQV